MGDVPCHTVLLLEAVSLLNLEEVALELHLNVATATECSIVEEVHLEGVHLVEDPLEEGHQEVCCVNDIKTL